MSEPIEYPDWSDLSKLIFRQMWGDVYAEIYDRPTIDIDHEVVIDKEPLRLEQNCDMTPSD